MTGTLDPRAEPPRWTAVLFRAIVPCRQMRNAILGDLHEELVRDCDLHGPEHAAVRYRNRALGILVHAAWDSVRWRTWTGTSEDPRAGRGRGGPGRVEAGSPEASPRRGRARRMGAAGGYVGVGIAAFVILGVGVVVNTSVFAAVDPAPALVDATPAVREALTLAPARVRPSRAKPTDAPEAATRPAPDGTSRAGVRAPLVLMAIGAGGLLLMIACATGAALVLCRAPGWGRRRSAAPIRPLEPPAA